MDELIKRAAALAAEIATLAGVETLSEAQQARWAEANAEIDTVSVEIEAGEKREAQIARAQELAKKAENRSPGTSQGTETVTVGTGPTVIVKRSDPFDLSEVRLQGNALGAELRSRALDAIEQAPERGRLTDAHRESATKLVDRNEDGDIARHVLATGSPEYHQAWSNYMRGRGMDLREVRASMSLTGANGGYLVPFTLDPTIILTNSGATNPFRGICTVKSITTDDWNGVSSAGVTAEWIAEATQVADASPTLAQPTITTYKADAHVQASFEVTQDSGIAGDIAMLIADAKDRLEATAHATGSGSGQPFGIVTALGLTTASRTAGSSGAAGAADFVIGDVYALANALPARFRPNSSWLSEQTTYNRIRQFATGSGPQHAFWADLGVDRPSTLLGRPTYESSAMDNTIVSGSNDDILIIGDFRAGYYIIDRIGLEIKFNDLVQGANNRPNGEVSWTGFWRMGGDSVADQAFQMLRV